MPARTFFPPCLLNTRAVAALACLVPAGLLSASPIADTDLKAMLTIAPASTAEVIKPGALQARYTEDDTTLTLFAFNGDGGIDFVAQFQGFDANLEDLDHWNANTHFQAFRVDTERVRVNTHLFLPEKHVGDVLPSPGYITLTYLEFGRAVHRFHQFLATRQAARATSHSAPPTAPGGPVPATAIVNTPAAAPATAQLATPAPPSASSTSAATSDQQQWTFPEINEAFSRLSELQREPFANSVKGARLSGRGNITEVGRCNFLDDSKRHGKKCLKITLDNDQPRAALYYPSSRQDELSALTVGSSHRFTDCEVIGITDYGFWTTVTCDMP